MTDHSMPVLPIVAGHGGHGCGDGFEPSDAALVQSTNLAITGQSVKDAQVESVRTSKDVLINRFEIERSLKELGVQAERIERENVRIVVEQGERTRDLMRSMDQDRRFEARLALIEAKLPAPKV